MKFAPQHDYLQWYALLAGAVLFLVIFLERNCLRGRPATIDDITLLGSHPRQ